MWWNKKEHIGPLSGTHGSHEPPLIALVGHDRVSSLNDGGEDEAPMTEAEVSLFDGVVGPPIDFVDCHRRLYFLSYYRYDNCRGS